MDNLVGTKYKHADLTKQIIGAFYTVYNTLGYGFLEKVYENAMVIELERSGIKALQQEPIDVYYAGYKIGQYFADLLVEGQVLVELKAIPQLGEENEAHLLNYLKATTCEVGLLLNFGPKTEIVRKAFNNDRKGSLSWIKPTS
jgi:GxxExxY protein